MMNATCLNICTNITPRHTDTDSGQSRKEGTADEKETLNLSVLSVFTWSWICLSRSWPLVQNNCGDEWRGLKGQSNYFPSQCPALQSVRFWSTLKPAGMQSWAHTLQRAELWVDWILKPAYRNASLWIFLSSTWIQMLMWDFLIMHSRDWCNQRQVSLLQNISVEE